MDISKGEENSHVQIALSPLAEACMRVDLTAVHSIIVTVQYQDDERIEELSFNHWTLDMQNTINSRIHGDLAFQDKDFRTATQWYTRVIDAQIMKSPTVYARRSLAYLFCGLAEAALRDAMCAEFIKKDWPTALYLQAAALVKLEMKNDAADKLREGAAVEAAKKLREGAAVEKW